MTCNITEHDRLAIKWNHKGRLPFWRSCDSHSVNQCRFWWCQSLRCVREPFYSNFPAKEFPLSSHYKCKKRKEYYPDTLGKGPAEAYYSECLQQIASIMDRKTYVKMAWVIVIPKEGCARVAAPILLLVWHWLFRFFFWKTFFPFFFGKKLVSYQKKERHGHGNPSFFWF